MTYHFFRGRLRLLETNYKEAERHFHYALQHCHVDAVHNRRTILSYYIPIKLHLNSLPRVRSRLSMAPSICSTDPSP